MTENKKTKLSNIIVKLKKGLKDNNNALDFSRSSEALDNLDDNEKLLLIKELIHITSLIDHIYCNIYHSDARDIEDEIVGIEAYNKKDLINLRSWLIKVIFLTFIVCFIIFLFMVFFAGDIMSSAMDVGETMFKLLKIIWL